MGSARRFSGRLVLFVAAAVAAALAVTPAAADFARTAWRHSKAIALPPGVIEGGLVEVAPDLEVFANAAPGLTDLRIVEAGSGEERPYKLLVERGDTRRGSVSLSMRDLASVPGQYTSFVADLGTGGVLHNEIEVHTPSQNFQRKVVIETSQDGVTWAVAQDKEAISDFTLAERNFTQRSTRVRYPITAARFVRVRVLDGGEAPIQVTGASAFFTKEIPPRETQAPATIAERAEDATRRATVVKIDMRTTGFPSSRLRLEVPQSNFYRRVRLDGSEDGETWASMVSSDVVFDFNTSRRVGNKLDIAYPETTYRYLRLTVFNEDNPPVPVTDVAVYGFERKVIFPATPSGQYTLFYGKPDARAPSYDLERILPYLVTENLPRAQLGPHGANPEFAVPAPPPPKPVPFTERYPWLLSVVVAVAGVFVGLFLASLLRQVRKVLPPPPA